MSLRRALPLASVRARAARRRVDAQLLAGALGDDDDRVRALLEPPLEVTQEPAVAVEAQRHLGDQHEVGVGRRQRRVAGDEARVAPHQLHQADAVARAVGLDVGAADHVDRGGEGALEAEAAVDEVDVVVDRLRDADHRDRQLAAFELGDDLGRAA